jgi:hypothetical protein
MGNTARLSVPGGGQEEINFPVPLRDESAASLGGVWTGSFWRAVLVGFLISCPFGGRRREDSVRSRRGSLSHHTAFGDGRRAAGIGRSLGRFQLRPRRQLGIGLIDRCLDGGPLRFAGDPFEDLVQRMARSTTRCIVAGQPQNVDDRHQTQNDGVDIFNPSVTSLAPTPSDNGIRLLTRSTLSTSIAHNFPFPARPRVSVGSIQTLNHWLRWTPTLTTEIPSLTRKKKRPADLVATAASSAGKTADSHGD